MLECRLKILVGGFNLSENASQTGSRRDKHQQTSSFNEKQPIDRKSAWIFAGKCSIDDVFLVPIQIGGAGNPESMDHPNPLYLSSSNYSI